MRSSGSMFDDAAGVLFARLHCIGRDCCQETGDKDSPACSALRRAMAPRAMVQAPSVRKTRHKVSPRRPRDDGSAARAGAFRAAGAVRAGGGVRPAARRRCRPSRQVRAASGEAEAIAACDVLVLATPIRAHAATVTRALAAGKHVLVEKPLCSTAAEAEALVAPLPLRRAPSRLFVGHSERFNPVVRALARLVRAEPVVALDFQRVGPSRPSECGVLVNLGVHDLDLAAYLGGGAVVLRGAVGDDDFADVLVETSGGAVGHLHVDRTATRRRRCAHAHHAAVDLRRRPARPPPRAHGARHGRERRGAAAPRRAARGAGAGAGRRARRNAPARARHRRRRSGRRAPGRSASRMCSSAASGRSRGRRA